MFKFKFDHAFIVDAADADLFLDTAFIVEADDTQVLDLWTKYGKPGAPDAVPWEQVMRGAHVGIGQLWLGKRRLGIAEMHPVAVSIQYAIIHGRRVMFYHGCSMIVDHEMIRGWLKYWTRETLRWDGGSRWAHCDAGNFHHCLDALTRRK